VFQLTPEQLQFQSTLRTFVAREITPFVNEWDEAETFPRELYRKVAAIGLLGLGYPEHLGGTEVDLTWRLLASAELARAGSGGLLASLFSHNIGLPPIVASGGEAMQRRVVPRVLAGEAIAALAVTEPGAGSDVAALATRARRDGNDYVIDGEKVFITSGMRADFLTVAVRTGGAGAGGLSLLLVEGDRPGLARTPLKKMGWWMSDTAHLRFDGCRVPVQNLIGEEDRGFAAIMENFNGERLLLAAGSWAFAQVCFDEALQWARDRRTFGAPLIARVAVRPGVASRGRPHRRRLGGRGGNAEESRHAGTAVVRRPGGADPGRHGLHARHTRGAHLPRSEGDDDRRRGRRSHEGTGGASAGAMSDKKIGRRGP